MGKARRQLIATKVEDHSFDDIIDRIKEALHQTGGNTLADIHNQIVPGVPRVTYIAEDAMFVDFPSTSSTPMS